jgi:hypothetical protein
MGRLSAGAVDFNDFKAVSLPKRLEVQKAHVDCYCSTWVKMWMVSM